MGYSNNEENFSPSVTRLPDKPPVPPSAVSAVWKKRFMRFSAIGTVSLLAIFGLGSIIARASFTNLYPVSCTGGWNGVERAGEKPDLEAHARPEDFTEANSAVFSGGADKHIECSWAHDVEEVVHAKILRVKLNLSWVFKEAQMPSVAEPVSSATGEQATSTQSTEPANPVPRAQGESTEAPIPSAEPTPSASESSHAIEVPSANQGQSTPEPVPVPTPTPAPAEPQALLHFIPIAQAQGNAVVPNVTASLVFNGIEHFLNIEYSLDGAEWKPVDNADLELPLANWEEMQKVLIRITVLKNEPGLPHIFLDGMWLEAMYIPQEANQSETVTEGNATSTGDGIATSTATGSDETASVLDTITGLAEDALQAITDLPQTIQDMISPDQNPAPHISENILSSGIVFPVEPKVEFIFEVIDNGSMEAGKDLPARADGQPQPAIAPGTDGTSLVITGECKMKYYTVLLFANPTDYLGDPTRAIVNRAGLCEGGKYRFELQSATLPSVLAGGTYYLLLTEQEEQKPWTAGTNPIRPIEITPHVITQ